MAQLDNIPAVILGDNGKKQGFAQIKSGEYVVRKEAVDKLGKNFMDMINNADRLGYGGGLIPEGEHGHSAIDELLAINTLNNQDSIEETRESAMMQEGGKLTLENSKYIVDGKPATKEMAMEHRIKKAMMNPMEFIQEQPRIFDFIKSDSPDTLKSILMDRVSDIQKTNKLSEKESSELIKLLQDAIYSDDSPYSDLIFEREMGMKEGGMHRPTFITGGDVSQSETGDQGGGGMYSSNYQPNAFFNSLYQQYGFSPTDDEIRRKFEESFALDLGDAYSEIEEGYAGLRTKMPKSSSDSTFALSGARERDIEDARQTLEDIAGISSERIITSSVDEQTEAGIAALASEEEAGAMMGEYEFQTPYSGNQNQGSGYMVVGQLPDTNQGKVEFNGQVYSWSDDEGRYLPGDFNFG